MFGVAQGGDLLQVFAQSCLEADSSDLVVLSLFAQMALPTKKKSEVITSALSGTRPLGGNGKAIACFA